MLIDESQDLEVFRDVPPTSALGIGFTGAHRTGKTTIAAKLAEVNSIPFAVSSASQIAEKMGFSLTKGAPFAERLTYQEALFDFFDDLYSQQTGIFLADRTPLDLAAYLMAEIPNDLKDDELIQRSASYIERCIDATNRHFAFVMAVQPGIPYVSEPGKPLANKGYQETIGALTLGLLYDCRVKTGMDVIPRGMTNAVERLEFTGDCISAAVKDYMRRVRLLPSC